METRYILRREGISYTQSRDTSIIQWAHQSHRDYHKVTNGVLNFLPFYSTVAYEGGGLKITRIGNQVLRCLRAVKWYRTSQDRFLLTNP